MPEPIARIAYSNREEVYNILFRATAETLTSIARDPQHLGAEIGFFAVLHTWGQNLLHHPRISFRGESAHLHCVVPGGGLSADGSSWVSVRMSTPVENSPAPVRWWFTDSAGGCKIEPAGKAEAGNAGEQPAEE